MAKINGIKGVKISRDEFRNSNSSDSSSGKTNTKQNLDEAMMQMLLGQVRYLNAKAEQIEANMKIAARREEERQQKEAEYRAKQQEREAERDRKEAERRISNFTNTDMGKAATNIGAAALFGPAGLAFGWMLNKTTGGLVDKGFNKLLGATGLFNKHKKNNQSSGLNSWLSGGSSTYSNVDGDNGALNVNRREMAEEPINRLNATVNSGFKQVIELMGGKWKGPNDGNSSGSGGLLSNLLGGLGGGLLSGLFTGLLPKLLKGLFRYVLPAAVVGAAGYWLYDQWEKNKEDYGVDGASAILQGETYGISYGVQSIGSGIQKAGEGTQRGAAALRNTTRTRVPSSGIKGAPTKAINSATRGVAKATYGAGTTMKIAGAGLKTAGRIIKPVGAGIDIYANTQEGYDKYKQTGDYKNVYEGVGSGVDSAVGGWAGALGGLKAGAAAGGAIGAAFGGVGAIPGAIIGGLVGLIGGAIGGSWLAKQLGIGKAIGGATYEATHDDEDKERIRQEWEQEYGQQYAYQTVAPTMSDNNEETVRLLSQISQSLESMERNTRPEVMQELDKNYINSIESTLSKTAPEPNTNGYTSDYYLPNNTNPLMV